MRKIGTIIFIFALLLVTSCSEQYNIAGNSTIGNFDGRTVYLKVTADGQALSCLDSCQVVHGRFNFIGDVDSVMMAVMYMDGDRLMPVVLENGNLNIEMGHCGSIVKGSPFNDRLNTFLRRRDRIENEQWELERRCMRMMREGKSYDEACEAYRTKASRLERKMERLETQFIRDNFDNALGRGCFLWLFGSYPIPVMTDQIRSIVRDAPATFLNDPFVSHYLRCARANSVPAEEDNHR